ncbi:MAG: class I SAM-dependent methyltransferase, partial [Acidobacteriota bacterium]|nr:class I SAM-dependent methyltransferase [Acidobacteriota bacterium]
MNISEIFGDIDIYLFDQILKNRFTPTMSILDAGCGGGRNLVYFLREDFQVFAVDREIEAIEYVRYLAKSLAPEISAENFQVSAIEKMPFADGKFDWVLSNAVLHFAEDEAQFNEMLSEMWRVLKP